MDIAVCLADTAGAADAKLDILGKMIDVLGTDEIDLVILNTASPALAMNVLRKKRLVADNNPAMCHRFESLAFKKYFDFFPVDWVCSQNGWLMVDTPLILRKLSQLQEFTAQLREYQTVTAGQYAAEWKTQRIIERTLQMAIEVCLDVAGHIISDKGYRIPNSYADTFAVLFENRVIDENFLFALEKMARCRNFIVHNYDKIDAEIIVGILKKNLPDFEAFKTAALSVL